jgi:hypothetical protein
MNPGKRFVYLLRSDRHPTRHYVGLTSRRDSNGTMQARMNTPHEIGRGIFSSRWNFAPATLLVSSSAI